ncbi:MAG: ComF family protein [Chloroflexi bacterium]|nr:ComF family protein [Chloroflexota bacterium]
MSSPAWQYSVYHNIWKVLDAFFPPTCAGCGELGSRWCSNCQTSVKVLDRNICTICGLPQEKEKLCQACAEERPRFRALRAWAAYEGSVRRALHRLKYRKDIGLGETLADAMIPFVRSLNWQPDLILPVPLGKKRLRERGYNQVAVVSRPLAAAMGISFSEQVLFRQKETQSQVGLNRRERIVNMNQAFSSNRPVVGKVVILMDDVATTGSTLSSAAGTLYDAGASEVFALTVARALRLDQS